MAKNVLCNNNSNIDTDKDTIDITNDNTKVLGPGEGVMRYWSGGGSENEVMFETGGAGGQST